MKRIGLKRIVSAAALSLTATVAHAQANFVSYECADGTQAVAAIYKGDKRMRLQVDGHAYTLPQRLSAYGARYSKSGISLWITGQEATLRRQKARPTACKMQ
ncbi:MAG: MliC family protein [Pseudomonadota bacterium]